MQVDKWREAGITGWELNYERSVATRNGWRDYIPALNMFGDLYTEGMMVAL